MDKRSVERDELAAVRDRIRTLREMTTDRGCSEYEALAAARKIAELMDRYSLSPDAVDRPAIVQARIGMPAARLRGPWIVLWSVIASCTGTSAQRDAGSLIFCGFETDALVADYLCEVLSRAANAARREFARSPAYQRKRLPRTRRQASEAFVDGFLRRIAGRLAEVFGGWAAINARAEQKRTLVDAWMVETGTMPTGGVVRPSAAKRQHPAFGGGVRAAEYVQISTGIGAAGANDAPPALTFAGGRS